MAWGQEVTSLGIDLGTGSVKALVLDRRGRQLASAAVPVGLLEPQPGWAESDPEEWWRAVVEATRQVLDRTDAPIGALGLSGQMHGVVLARSDGRALRPAVLSLDRRAEADLGAYRSLPARELAALGNPLVPGMAGPLLHWLSHHEAQVLERADWALQPKDWLRLRLVGEAGSEPSDASGTLLFDLRSNCWSLPVAAALGIPPSLLAPLGRPSDVAGLLQGPAARELGLPAGLPVAFGAADTAAALVGTAMSGTGGLQLTVGSAAQVVALRTSPEPDPALRYHLFASAEEGIWYALAAVQAAGVVLSWVLRTFQATWEEAYEHLTASPLGARGAIFVPHLAGARSPSMNSRARGAFAGLELAQSRSDIFRAAFEGVAFSIAEAAAVLPEFSGASAIYLAGGGTLHGAWRQLLCDALGKALFVLDEPNASARGAALLGGRAAGIIDDLGRAPRVTGKVEPDPEAQRALSEAFGRWKAVASALARSSP